MKSKSTYLVGCFALLLAAASSGCGIITASLLDQQVLEAVGLDLAAVEDEIGTLSDDLQAGLASPGAPGAQGAKGDTGDAGADGVGNAGAAGIDCWDTNGDGNNDAAEDTNGDGKFDALDCQGADGTGGTGGTVGPVGPVGPVGAVGPVGPDGNPGADGLPGGGGQIAFGTVDAAGGALDVHAEGIAAAAAHVPASGIYELWADVGTVKPFTDEFDYPVLVTVLQPGVTAVVTPTALDAVNGQLYFTVRIYDITLTLVDAGFNVVVYDSFNP